MYIDTHIDSLYHMLKNSRTFNNEEETSHVDLPKARKGGLCIGFFTGYPTDNHEVTEKMVRDWIQWTGNSDNGLKVIKTIPELDMFLSNYNEEDPNRQIGCVFHLEGASGIDKTLNQLYIYHAVGLRSMSLTWNDINKFATGTLTDKSQGLGSHGKDILSAMEDLGILIDVSHLNDKSFWEVVSNTNNPIFASHSNLRKRADSERNLTDEMVLAIAESGGSIGLNFHKGFLSTKETHPANMKCGIEMISEIMNITGSSKYAHIGADFDGCTLPSDIKDITSMPDFFLKLQKDLDLSNKELNDIKHENVLQLMKKVWI